MKTVELFCGTKSFSKVAKKLGYDTFTVDIDEQFKPDLVKDILEIKPEDIPLEFHKPFILWASPPCTTFSVASIRYYWENGKPKNDKTLKGIAIIKKTLEIINALKPKYWIMENPRGMLRKQKFMKYLNLNRKTVTYCQYGLSTQKPTDLWNNIINWIPRPMCKPGAPCHERASRGTTKGVQGINNSFSNLGSRGKVLRAVVPPALCEEIIKACELKI